MNRIFDVAIMGGGLAGLTLAVQLKRKLPDINIVVIEKSKFPVPESAHKVGESTVEIGAHYYANIVGLKDHLENKHLHKFGLRFHFGNNECKNLSEFNEIGGADYLPIRTYQIDRGIIENELYDLSISLDIEILDGCRINSTKIGDRTTNHKVIYKKDNYESAVESKWLVDASGRKRIINSYHNKSKLPEHPNSAVWFRIDKKFDIDTWDTTGNWEKRLLKGPRWLSTNHFMGKGYWLWLIPLSTGATSIGLVFDHTIISFREVNTFDKFKDWIIKNQPIAAEQFFSIAGTIMDFRFIKNYSHHCNNVFSTNKWAITGDAGVFLDPLYSPGSDFIAISNTFITEMITDDYSGSLSPYDIFFYENIFFSFVKNTFELYRKQYVGLNNYNLMYCKSIWDYSLYWSVLAKLFFSGNFKDIKYMKELMPHLSKIIDINKSVQNVFRAKGEEYLSTTPSSLFVDHYKIPWFYNFHRGLEDNDMSANRLITNIDSLSLLAEHIKMHTANNASANMTENKLYNLLDH